MKLNSVMRKQNLVSKLIMGSGVNLHAVDIKCKSHRLMQQMHLIAPSGSGTFSILPIAMRSLQKLTKLIEKEMSGIGCLKVSMPCLSSAALWKKSGRWENFGDELMKLTVGGTEHCLNPTHEEIITSMISSTGIVPDGNLPLRLYQITTKFRDEPRPRFGLLRCREFLMKDLYTFDKDEESAVKTYSEVCQTYENIFKTLGLDFIKAKSSCGEIGGEMSHEFLVASDIGEDKVFLDKDGGAWNAEYEGKVEASGEEISAIEIGHTFHLGTLYSDIFKAYHTSDSRRCLLHMGCFGIGVSRLLATCIEIFSKENCIRWPYEIAPFKVCIVPPKAGSKEEEMIGNQVNELYTNLNNVPFLFDEIIIDDRTNRTIGKRLHDVKLMGYPVVIVFGKKSVEGIVEVLFQNQDKLLYVPISDVIHAISTEFS